MSVERWIPALLALVVSSQVALGQTNLASAQEKFRSCTLNQIELLDDGVSPASNIAEAAVEGCEVERIALARQSRSALHLTEEQFLTAVMATRAGTVSIVTREVLLRRSERRRAR